jgi:hypothetical protein
MKSKSIIFAVAMVLMLTISAFAHAENVVKSVTIEWVENRMGHVYKEVIYCAADCQTVVDKRVKEIEQSGGKIIDVVVNDGN